MARSLAHPDRIRANRHDLQQGLAVFEFVAEAFVILTVLVISAVLTSAVLRSGLHNGPVGADSCEVAGR
jgi:hypothetical protein